MNRDESNLLPSMHCKAPSPGDPTWFKGDRAEFTGKSRILYGALFDEIHMLEGAHKGKLLHKRAKIAD